MPASGPKTLTGHLLTLAQYATPDGAPTWRRTTDSKQAS